MAAAILGTSSATAQKPPQEAQVAAESSAPSPHGKLLFAMTYRPGEKWQPGKPFREQIAIGEHYGYMKSLFAKGQIFSAGGVGTEHGLVLLYARDQAEADAILAADPMIQAGSFNGTIERYSPSFISDVPLSLTRE